MNIFVYTSLKSERGMEISLVINQQLALLKLYWWKVTPINTCCVGGREHANILCR